MNRRAADPEKRALPPLAHHRKHRAVDPMRPQHIDRKVLRDLVWRKRFGRTQNKMTGIVHQNVDLTSRFQDRAHRRIDGTVREDIHLDRVQRQALTMCQRS